MRKENQDVIGEKCVMNDAGNLSIDKESKRTAWKEHYEGLLNEEFPWNPNHLNADPVEGPPIQITIEMVATAIAKMKPGKAAGPSGIVAEMLKASGGTGAKLVAELANTMIKNSDDWDDSFIINREIAI